MCCFDFAGVRLAHHLERQGADGGEDETHSPDVLGNVLLENTFRPYVCFIYDYFTHVFTFTYLLLIFTLLCMFTL